MEWVSKQPQQLEALLDLVVSRGRGKIYTHEQEEPHVFLRPGVKIEMDKKSW